MGRRSVGGALSMVALMTVTGCAAAQPTWTPPAPATSAHEAVQQFLSAVVDGRSGDAASVLRPEATAAGVGRHWLEDPPPLSEIRFGTEHPDRAARVDSARYSDQTFVPVTFYLDDFSLDQGFEGGETGWGYIVGHTADDGWLILDNGMA